MIVYLVRHGKAEDGEDDDLRRLTQGGVKSVERVARMLSSSGVRPTVIRHSGLARARQTAEILGAALETPVEHASGLRPLDSVDRFAAGMLDRSPDGTMLVGHLPFMSRLATQLVTGDQDRELLHFRTASVACLALADGRWQLEWFLTPKLA